VSKLHKNVLSCVFFWWVIGSWETFDILFYALVGNLEHTVSVLLQHVIMLSSGIMGENDSGMNLKEI